MDNNKCYECSREWQERYNLAVKRFDRNINIATTITIISICIALICVILSSMCLAKTLNFIKEFEYVEETVISQDGEGYNTAVIVNN